MDYIENLRYEQLPLLFEQVASFQEYLLIPSSLTGFHNTDTTSEFLPNGRNSLCMNGTLSLPVKTSIKTAMKDATMRLENVLFMEDASF